MILRHLLFRHARAAGGAPAVLAALLGLAGCAGAVLDERTSPAARPVTAAEAAEVFDSAWSRVHRTYYDTAFNGLDWEAVRDELRPRPMTGWTAETLREMIDEMLSRLGDSHFGVIPAEAADALEPDSLSGAAGEPGDAGLELRVVAGDLVVFRIDPEGPAARAGIRTGWMVESIDTVPARRYLDVIEEIPGERRLAEARVAWAAAARLDGRVGDTVTVRLRDGSDTPVDARLAVRPQPGTAVRFGNLPAQFLRLEQRALPTDGGCVGLIRFNVWMTPVLPQFEDALLALESCHGTVIDLRGNPGGIAGLIMGTSGYFMDETRALGRMITRENELRLVSMPRRVTRDGRPLRPDARPLALLLDGMSMSTSELFAAGLQSVGRARVFGETSGGQALPAMMARLPNRDVLMYVFANYVDPDGARIEGRGVVPDEEVPLNREDLLEGRDAALEAAVEWIRGQAARSATH